jgi:serine kinase of HPr protein (carbohydrate metabolism regulator)
VSEFSVSLAKLAEEANLTIAYTPCELEKIQVTATEVYRPGILLAGYYENFDSKRIQIIGLTEMSYLDELTTTLRSSTASSAIRRWPRLTSSMAVSLLPTPESPRIRMPSP